MGGGCSNNNDRGETERSMPISQCSLTDRTFTLNLIAPSVDSDIPGLDAMSTSSDGEIRIGKEVSIEVPTGKYKGRQLRGLVLRSEPGNIDYYWVRIQEDELSRKTKTADNVMRVHHKRITSHVHNPQNSTCAKNIKMLSRQSSNDSTGSKNSRNSTQSKDSRGSDGDPGAGRTSNEDPGPPGGKGRKGAVDMGGDRKLAERTPTGRTPPSAIRVAGDPTNPEAGSPISSNTADRTEHGVEVPLPPDTNKGRADNESDELT